MSLRTSELPCHSILLLPVDNVLHVKSTTTAASSPVSVFQKKSCPTAIRNLRRRNFDRLSLNYSDNSKPVPT